MTPQPQTIKKKKVLAYVTRGNQLLVFKHAQFPEAGLQVPAGTVEANEELDKAILRETEEETGMKDFSIKAYLGKRLLEYEAEGKQVLEERHYFHLLSQKELPETWTSYEWNPSDGSLAPIEFVFFWLELSECSRELFGTQAELLSALNSDRE